MTFRKVPQLLTALFLSLLLILPVCMAEGSMNPKLVIDPNIGAKPTPTPLPKDITIPGWGGIKIQAGVEEADIALYNPEENADWYYLTFEVRLKETDEIVFSTGLIPPGMYCTKAVLSHPFEKGTYPCILHVQPYRMDAALSETNNAEMDIELIVE